MDPTSSKRRRISPSRHIAIQGDHTSEQDSEQDIRRVSSQGLAIGNISRPDPKDQPLQRESASAALRAPRGLNPAPLRPKLTAPRLSASPPEDDSSPSNRARKSRDARRTLSLSRVRQTKEDDEDDDEANPEELSAPRSLLEEEKLAESVSRRGPVRGIARASFAPETAREEKEPDLPPTRTELGLETRPRSPAGVMSSSPRPKASARKAILKSSPLKPKDGPAPTAEAPAEQAISQQAVKGTIEEVEDDVEVDPEVTERQQRLDQLSKQLAVLRDDVAFLQAQAVGRTRDTNLPQRTVDRLVNLMTTASSSEQPESSPLKPTTLTSRLSSFMPFAKKLKVVPKDPLLEEEFLPSYKPVEGVNPLQHLQAFTSFTVSSTSQLAVIEAQSALVHVQDITLSSTNLEIDLNLLSDTDTDTIEQLTLRSISPWAEAELGSWIRKQAEETADISTIGWGSSRYLDLAQTRAKCWAKCARAFPQYASLPRSTSAPSSQNPPALSLEAPIGDPEIARYVGKPSFRLESSVSHAALTITWTIELDWIGDVESRVSAAAALPSQWVERDKQRNSLGKIPETFDRLVRKIGVFEAVRVLVGVVLGGGEGE